MEISLFDAAIKGFLKSTSSQGFFGHARWCQHRHVHGGGAAGSRDAARLCHRTAYCYQMAAISFVFTVRGRLRTKQEAPTSLAGAMARTADES